MKSVLIILPALLISALTGGCATTTTTKPIDKLLESGEAMILSNSDYAEMIVGNTVNTEGGGPTYYRDDGVKLAKPKSGEVIVREWNLNDSGILCQTLVKSNEMSCLDESNMRIAISGETIYLIGKDNVWAQTISEGNSSDLSE